MLPFKERRLQTSSAPRRGGKARGELTSLIEGKNETFSAPSANAWEENDDLLQRAWLFSL